jgi:hypothetical protein
MAFVGDLFSSDKGAGFQAKSAEVTSPVSFGEVNAANQQATSAVNQQQAFVNALMAAQPGAMQNQQFVSDQLIQQAQGLGPNPALAQLNQATGQNVANQAALMAGQRGAGANAGLIARQIAQQGAGVQQQAVGQGAIMQAGQQLAAQNQLQNLTGQQIGQNQNALTGLNQFSQGNQGNLLNAMGQFNNAQVGMQGNMNSANAGVAGINANNQAKGFGGLLNGVGGFLGLAEGGVVPDGGPASAFGRHLASYMAGGTVPGVANAAGDSKSNDTVPAMLSPGEIVIPRSVVNSANPAENAAKFVAAVMAKKRHKGK